MCPAGVLDDTALKTGENVDLERSGLAFRLRLAGARLRPRTFAHVLERMDADQRRQAW